MLTVISDDLEIITQATNGHQMMHGINVLIDAFLKNNHDTFLQFPKWFVTPGTGEFYLMPDDDLTHTPSRISPEEPRSSSQ